MSRESWGDLDAPEPIRIPEGAYTREIEVIEGLYLVRSYQPGDSLAGVLLHLGGAPYRMLAAGWGYDLPKWPIRPWPLWGPDTTPVGHRTWTLMWLGFHISLITARKGFDAGGDCSLGSVE